MPYLAHGLCAEADSLQGAASKTGFWSKPAVDDASGDAVVERAIAQAKCGDQHAMRYIYLRYADNIYGYVHSIVRDAHEAEDITQQLFLKLIRVLHQYEPRSVPFSSWLLRLAHNLAMDHLRSPGRRLTPCEEVRPLDEDQEPDDRSHALREAISSLSDDQRNVLVLRHVAGLSPREIADRLGKTESSVHGLHHRGRRALQARLRLLDSAPSTVGCGAALS
jgi:RNA polymerase sigma-70 factor (ECF subfamily)